MRRLKRLIAWVLVVLLVITTSNSDMFATTMENEADTPEVLINYLVVEEPMLTTPESQTVMLGIGGGSYKIEAAVLTYRNQATGEVYATQATEMLDDFVMFEMEYADDSWNGTYCLETITYTVEGNEVTASFAEIGIYAAFGVNQIAESSPDDVLLSEEEVEALAAETEMNVVALDEEGNIESEISFEQAIEHADQQIGEAIINARKGAGEDAIDATGMSGVVVVLDAGHGGSDPGAQANGVVEKTVNLKIAQYCKEELEEYAGIKVYMTRSTDTYLTLAERAQVAVDKKADLFVSLHNNSHTSSSVSGAEVYYPNANYNAECGTIGKSLASIILSNLTDLGLADKGIKIRNSENGTKYPDGSTADYYGVIKRCKENGIPAIIVEHAFISNASDAKNYLTTDEQLEKLGIASATAIAEYYDLSKGFGFSSVRAKGSTGMELKWPERVGVSGYAIYRSTSKENGFVEVAKIDSSAITSWEDSGLEPGVTYYYKICTYMMSGGNITYGKYSPVAWGITMERPAISSIKSKSNKQLVISWPSVNSAATYEIYRSAKKNGTYKLLSTVSGINTVKYIDKTVKSGKLYYYKVRSLGDVDGTTVYSDYSDIVSGRTASIPTGLSVKSMDSNTLRVSWTADVNVSGYVVKRATSLNGKYEKIATVEGASTNYYDDATVTANKAYYYKIQAYNHNNGVKGNSGFGTPVGGKTIKKTSIKTVVSTAPKKQTISWKKIEGVTGYVIYQSTEKNGNYKKIKKISSNAITSYSVSGLVPGNEYFYKIRTMKKANGKTEYGSYSAIRSAWTGAKAKIKSVEGSTGKRILVSWEPVNQAERYDIYRSSSLRGEYRLVGTVDGANAEYLDKNLKMTSQYYYKVEARMKGYKAVGTSGKSAAVGGYPVRKTTITSVAANEQGALQITWDKIKNIKGYEIYRSTEKKGKYKLLKTISGYKNNWYVDTKAKPNVIYYYKVRPVNKYAGEIIYGKYSAIATGLLLPAPQNVTVTSIAENQLNVNWEAVKGAYGYAVYRSTELNGAYAQIGFVPTATLTTYSDMTVTKGVTYYYKVKTVDLNNKSSQFSKVGMGCAVAKLTISSLKWSADKKSITISWEATAPNVTGYEVYKSSSSSVTTQTKVAMVTGTSCVDLNVNVSETYYYRIRSYKEVYVNNKKQIEYGIFSDTLSTNVLDYRIMGSPEATEKQMVAMYNASGKKYPSNVYKDKGAATIEEFCKILYEESCIEGVKPEVMFAQICHETSYLQFGGQVQASQCNFGGLGAVDGGGGGGVFADVRTGIRTQVQHMKAYASTNPLKLACIDGRFGYVKRGTAEYVQQLGKGNWASDTLYDVKLMTYINKIKSY